MGSFVTQQTLPDIPVVKTPEGICNHYVPVPSLLELSSSYFSTIIALVSMLSVHDVLPQ